MRTVVAVVEGHGEVEAVPVLLRRLAVLAPPDRRPSFAPPIRVARDRLLNRQSEFSRTFDLARAKVGAGGAVLLLLDADDDCPATLGPDLARRVSEQLGVVRSAVVLANREFESWFIAAGPSLQAVRGFTPPERWPADPDVPRDAKGWMADRLPKRAYQPVIHQAAFAAQFDIDMAAARSRSFRHFLKAWAHLTAS